MDGYTNEIGWIMSPASFAAAPNEPNGTLGKQRRRDGGAERTQDRWRNEANAVVPRVPPGVTG
jgi:hypothetical protein